MLSTEPMMVRCLLRWKAKTIIWIILGHIIIAYNHIVGKSNVGKDYLDKGGLNLVEWIYWDKLAINFINGIRSLCRLNNSFAPHVWFHWWLVHVGLFLGVRGLALWGGGELGGGGGLVGCVQSWELCARLTFLGLSCWEASVTIYLWFRF